MFLILSRSILATFFFFHDRATTDIYTLSLHDALPICRTHRACSGRRTPGRRRRGRRAGRGVPERASEGRAARGTRPRRARSEEHTSELQSRQYLVCRLLLEKKKKKKQEIIHPHVNNKR